ncbi:MAG: SidA/IucD/PvdA family monooxygenase [Bacteroidota bacterium]|nr:SidA/IucD/PvdA family monooxygenase [Bacteroidota bacterium]
MSNNQVFDLIGIGIGPFNLGLAALSQTIPGLKALFLDQTEAFDWHPGLMIPDTRMQVPFYADLVTLSDPGSSFSYMAYLKASKRLFRFAIHENYFLTRSEYNRYCRWVASQLPSLRFNSRCHQVLYDPDNREFTVITAAEKFKTRHLVIGTGTIPYVPPCAFGLPRSQCVHSGSYLHYKKSILDNRSVTLVGSGQSAAEIFLDLLGHREKFNQGIGWFTRSERFFPMEYSSLSLEMSTPDYIDHFFSLPRDKKKEVLSRQDMLYKGINFSLIREIYDTLYDQDLEGKSGPVSLHTNCILQTISRKDQYLKLGFHHNELGQEFSHDTPMLILATGYQNRVPCFLDSIKSLIHWNPTHQYEVSRNYTIDRHHRIFVQNAETHTHGFNAADLSLGPYRNAVILNTILGYTHYETEQNITFQSFGIPPKYQKEEPDLVPEGFLSSFPANSKNPIVNPLPD